ncbi:lyase family protein [Microcoleus sp. F10-C6]|uniref:lyase family protein n=1 Tax=unclassified Microcoleus TaxID=2642155 RepID=UPI002FD16703
MRYETDSLGTLPLPEELYYGINTERGRQNCEVSNTTIGDFHRYLACVAMVKKAAALTNAEIGTITKPVAEAICKAADELIAGKIDKSNFPVDVYNAGGGVSVNMNVNEVLANRANEMIVGHKGYEIVHPNNHVNSGQSTSDVIATALNLTLYFEILELLDSLKLLEQILTGKIDEYKDVVKLARTCIQDAVPITFAQEFSAYLAGVQRGITRLEQVLDACLDVPMGATVVGTGLGINIGYADLIYHHLREVTGLQVRKHPNFFDCLQNGDIFQHISTSFKALATGLSKMARDLRILSSGNRTGMLEMILPAVQAGSSFMPGKINPTMPEFINQIAYQVCGNDVTVTMAVEGAELDMNVWTSIIAKNLFESCQLLKKGIPLFAEKCIKGIVVRKDVCQHQAENTLALSPVIAAIYGYETGSKVVKYAYKNNLSIKQAVIELKVMTEALAEELLDPLMLTDASRSAAITQRMEKVQKEAIKSKIASIQPLTRQKIFEVIGSVVLADSVIAKEEELIVHVASDALQLQLSKDEISNILSRGSVELEGLDTINPKDRDLLYLCASWVASADGSVAGSEEKLLDNLRTLLNMEQAKAEQLRNQVKTIREERSEFIPKSEELPWWDEFERILVKAIEVEA